MGGLWILSWEWLSHHLHDCLVGSQNLGFPHCALNTEETALNIAFVLLHGGRSADKIGARLERRRERNFHSGACKHLRAPSSGGNWAISHCALPRSLLAWEPRFLGPKPSLTYLQLKLSQTPQGSVFSFLGWGRLDFVQNTCSRLKLSADQWTNGSEVCVAEDSEAVSNGPGAVIVWWCSWILGSGLGVVHQLAFSCSETEDLRGLDHRILTSLGFWEMRSGHYKSEVTSGEACRFFGRNPNQSDEFSLLNNTGNKLCQG